MQKYNASLFVDLNAIAQNYQKLAHIAKPAICAAVVKANAYGMGTKQVVQALYHQGCRIFFTAFIQEAEIIRRIFPDTTLYVLNGLPKNAAKDFHKLNIRPILSTAGEIEQWTQFTKNIDTPISAAIHVDSGINRLGITQNQFIKLIENKKIPNQFPISLLMSHLACAETPNHPMNQKQKKKFEQIIKQLPQIPASLANSYAMISNNKTNYSLTRPGIALYGGHIPNYQNPLYTPKHVVTLTTDIMQIKQINVGETVGYGNKWKAKRKSIIAVIPVGYADGYPRSLSGINNEEQQNQTRGYVYICGHKAPIIGRISMDMITIDISDIPQNKINPNTKVELIGENISIDEIAQCANTIPYEILTNLGNRYQRQYPLTFEQHNANHSENIKQNIKEINIT